MPCSAAWVDQHGHIEYYHDAQHRYLAVEELRCDSVHQPCPLFIGSYPGIHYRSYDEQVGRWLDVYVLGWLVCLAYAVNVFGNEERTPVAEEARGEGGKVSLVKSIVCVCILSASVKRYIPYTVSIVILLYDMKSVQIASVAVSAVEYIMEGRNLGRERYLPDIALAASAYDRSQVDKPSRTVAYLMNDCNPDKI